MPPWLKSLEDVWSLQMGAKSWRQERTEKQRQQKQAQQRGEQQQAAKPRKKPSQQRLQATSSRKPAQGGRRHMPYLGVGLLGEQREPYWKCDGG